MNKLIIILMLASFYSFCQSKLDPSDIKIEESSTYNGFLLFIKQKEGINSVMITESTVDKTYSYATYAFRAKEKNEINGDEKRILNGNFLDTTESHFLIDSTPEQIDGQNYFKILLPYSLEYGYAWTRNGQIDLKDGTYLNIRTFKDKYGSYDGGFTDNPFILRIEQKPKFTGKYSVEAQNQLSCIVNGSGGRLIKSKPNIVSDDIKKLIDELYKKNNDLEVSVVLDTTASMKKSFDNIKDNLISDIKGYLGDDKLKLSFNFFKDYGEKYLYSVQPFYSSKDEIQKVLDKEEVEGGKDIPEATNEAIFASLSKSEWKGKNRVVIVITDAPPHESQKGAISFSMVLDKAKKENTSIYTILLPQ